MSEREIERLEEEAKALRISKKQEEKKHQKNLDAAAKLHEENLLKEQQKRAQVIQQREDAIRAAEEESDILNQEHKAKVDRNFHEINEIRKKHENEFNADKQRIRGFMDARRNEYQQDLQKHRETNEAKSRLVLEHQKDQQERSYVQSEKAEKELGQIRISAASDIANHTKQQKLDQQERNNEIKADTEKKYKVIQEGKLQHATHRQRLEALEMHSKVSQISMINAHSEGQKQAGNATTVNNVKNKCKDFVLKFEAMNSRLQTIRRPSGKVQAVCKVASQECETCLTLLSVLSNYLATLDETEIDDKDEERLELSNKAKNVITLLNEGFQNLSEAIDGEETAKIAKELKPVKEDVEKLKNYINKIPIVRITNLMQNAIAQSSAHVEKHFMVDQGKLEKQKKELYAIKNAEKSSDSEDDDSDSD